MNVQNQWKSQNIGPAYPIFSDFLFQLCVLKFDSILIVNFKMKETVKNSEN